MSDEDRELVKNFFETLVSSSFSKGRKPVTSELLPGSLLPKGKRYSGISWKSVGFKEHCSNLGFSLAVL